MAFDMMTFVNLVFALAILALGMWNFLKSKNAVSLYVGVGFGLFGVSHLMTLAGLAVSLSQSLVVFRTVGYMSVILGLYVAMKPAPKPSKKK
jgi:hypothetical protein